MDPNEALGSLGNPWRKPWQMILYNCLCIMIGFIGCWHMLGIVFIGEWFAQRVQKRHVPPHCPPAYPSARPPARPSLNSPSGRLLRLTSVLTVNYEPVFGGATFYANKSATPANYDGDFFRHGTDGATATIFMCVSCSVEKAMARESGQQSSRLFGPRPGV